MGKLIAICSLISVVFMAGCGSSGGNYTCEACTSVPDAKPADDGQSTGVYKGVLVGDDITGTIFATIETDESAGGCKIVVNGEIMENSDFSAGPLGDGAEYTFSSDRFEFDLEVDSTGNVENSNLLLDDKPIVVIITKETSDHLVECFEGTWSGEYSGVWNFLVTDNRIEGRYDGDSSGNFVGTFSGNEANINTSGGSSLASGTRRDDKVSGGWDYSGVSGNWLGRRTL